MKTLILGALLLTACSGTFEPVPLGSSHPAESACTVAVDGSRSISLSFRAWMEMQACKAPSGLHSSNDPCTTGTITIACPSPSCVIWGGPVTCTHGSLFYGADDRECTCVPGTTCFAVPIQTEPEQGVCR